MDPAHDLNWLALAGYLDATKRRADGGPALPGATVADTVGGHSAAVAVLAALLERTTTGEGRFLDVAIIDGVLRTMQFALDEHLAEPNGTGARAASCTATPVTTCTRRQTGAGSPAGRSSPTSGRSCAGPSGWST